MTTTTTVSDVALIVHVSTVAIHNCWAMGNEARAMTLSLPIHDHDCVITQMLDDERCHWRKENDPGFIIFGSTTSYIILVHFWRLLHQEP